MVTDYKLETEALWEEDNRWVTEKVKNRLRIETGLFTFTKGNGKVSRSIKWNYSTIRDWRRI